MNAVLNQTKLVRSSEFLSGNNGSKLVEIAHNCKTVGTPIVYEPLNLTVSGFSVNFHFIWVSIKCSSQECVSTRKLF